MKFDPKSGLGPWRKASRCSHTNCVEVSVTGRGKSIELRDTKHATPLTKQPAITFSRAEWEDFLDALVSNSDHHARGFNIEILSDGRVTIANEGKSLTFDVLEWQVFIADVMSGEIRSTTQAKRSRMHQWLAVVAMSVPVISGAAVVVDLALKHLGGVN